MASRAECDDAVQSLVDLLAGVDADVLRKVAAERSVSCRVTDLDVTYAARLDEAGLRDVAVDGADAGRAQVRLTVASDDLVALVQGRLAVTTAWAVGRLRVHASPLDLLRLRALL